MIYMPAVVAYLCCTMASVEHTTGLIPVVMCVPMATAQLHCTSAKQIVARTGHGQ